MYSLLPRVMSSFGVLFLLTSGSLLHRSTSLKVVARYSDIFSSILLLLSLPLLDSRYIIPFILTYFILMTNRGGTFEYSLLLLLSLLGLSLLLSSSHLLMMYLGLELSSQALFILATLSRGSAFSTEAGLKYFLVGSLASVVYLVGCSYLYYESGSLDIYEVSLVSDGFYLIILSLRMKLAASPLHWWAPDVYEGAPMSSARFIVLIPKMMLFLLLYKLVAFSSLPFILISGFLSVLMGMVGALTQTGLKRFLSYSGVGHMGFLLLGVYSEASLFYLLLYIAVTVVAWGLLSEVRRLEPLSSDPLKYLSDLSGMVHRHRGVAVLFSISMFSMAGVPPLAGFFAKLQVLFSLLDDSVVLALGAILISVISTFYYLRLSKRMVFEDVDGASVVSVMSWHIPLILSSLLLSFFMIQPESLMILSSVLSKALISGTPI